MKLNNIDILQLNNKKYLIDFLSSVDKVVHQKFKLQFVIDGKLNYEYYNTIFFNYILKKSHNAYNILQHDVQSLYNNLYNHNGYCNKCKKQLKFISFNKGYDSCEFCLNEIINSIKDKKDIINYINNAHYNIPLIKFIYTDPVLKCIFNKISKKFNTEEELYLFLYETSPHYCDYCGKPTKFIRFKPLKDREHYKQFCSSDCRNNWWSNQQKLNNTVLRIHNETMQNMRNSNSEHMKMLIQLGKFTPNYTNSWCHSMYKITFMQNNKLVTKKYRSSWEVIFQLLYPNMEYEKLRIPYIGTDNKKHIYIVDFIDFENKKVYEVKPNSCKNTNTNIIKHNTLKSWCNVNGFTCTYIDEFFIKKHIFDVELLKYTDDVYKEKLLSIIKKYKYIELINENKEYKSCIV